ncbi:MAG: CNP1-like family protein [Proteobacteria bacterium]|nr:CNP1-like family protein [Pseudomonadota bacterium]
MRWLAALALALACGAAFGQRNQQFSPDFKPEELYGGSSEERPDWKEGDVKLPAYPQPGNLIEFQVSALNSFRFFVDPGSISAGADGVVRFTLVARSRSGTENVSYDGLRCSSGEQRTYANGRVADKSWFPVRDGKWKPVEVKTVSRQYLVLMRDFFCPARIPIATAAEGIDALKRGYHPQAVSNQPEYIRQ